MTTIAARPSAHGISYHPTKTMRALDKHHAGEGLAFDPARLAGAEAEASAQRAEALFEAVTSQGARLPSQRRFTARERSLCEGVSVPAGLYREMLAMAAGNG